MSRRIKTIGSSPKDKRKIGRGKEWKRQHRYGCPGCAFFSYEESEYKKHWKEKHGTPEEADRVHRKAMTFVRMGGGFRMGKRGQ